MRASSPGEPGVIAGRFTLSGLIVGIAMVFCLFSWATPALGQVAGADVYQALEKSPRVRVIIALRPPAAPLTDLPAVKAEIFAIQSRVLAQLGAADFTLSHRWETLSALAGELTKSGLDKLLADPEVLRIDLDVEGGGGLAQSVPLIKANQVQALGFTGEGVTVAVLDTGIDTNHPDLMDHLEAEQCFCAKSDGTGCCPNGTTQQSGAGSAEDDNGHGTNVAGIISSKGIVAPRGVAPDAKVVAVKVLDKQGSFYSATQVIQALDWIIASRPDVKVVNMSLGTSAQFAGECDSATSWTLTFAQAINTLRSKGVTVFASSMNTGSGTTMGVPACLASAVAVGAVYDSNVGSVTVLGCTDATTAADKVTCFSNSNSKLELMAPGAPITSTGMGGGTSTYYGTSQASPHAAAAAALLLDAAPALTPDQIETAFKTTGVHVTDAKNGLTFPRIDVLAALKSLSPSAATLVAPTGTLGTITPTYTWNAVPTATWYYLWVNDASGSGKVLQWVTADAAGCGSGTGTCSITSSTPLAPGLASWWVQTWGPGGYGPWSSGMSFTVPALGVPPAVTTLSTPGGAISTPTPTYTWTAVPTATWYYLWVNDPTGGGKITQWLRAADWGCGSGTCSYTPSIALAPGAAVWWLQTWNPAGYGPWSASLSFTVPALGVPPAVTTLTSPTGTSSTHTPTYTWAAVPTSTWYYLWVTDSTGTKLQQWYSASGLGCASGTCTLTPAMPLAAGAATWWVQTWNSAGYGPWSTGMTFTVVP